jgi:hypothetical protein
MSQAALDQANEEQAHDRPAQPLVMRAYWTSVGNREYLRWVLPDDEDRVLDGLARLHAADAEHLVEGDRLIGMFRAHGLVTPVWDLPLGTGAEALEEPAERVREGPARGDGFRGPADPRTALREGRSREPPAHHQVTRLPLVYPAVVSRSDHAVHS